MARDSLSLIADGLAPYAASESSSKGRQYDEREDPSRTLYQRDCDRIVHSAAFRCLEYKTQVMVNHADGLFRTRLTHSMEVARLSRTLAQSLRLNEDLAEAIALAHDLGHTPFGHPGQETLNRCMKQYGGFEHNLQSYRVICKLEHKYAQFRGLNLSFEARDGVLKRCPRELAKAMGPVGERFLRNERATLEAQLVDCADRIAYTNHDLDDGLRLGFLDLEEVQELELFAEAWKEAAQLGSDLSRHSLLHETNRRLITRMIRDLIEATQGRLADAAIDSVSAVRKHDVNLADFSAAMQKALQPVTLTLHRGYYDHFQQVRAREVAQRVMEGLFERFMESLKLLPSEVGARAELKQQSGGDAGRARVIADYIASLSDREIFNEYRKVFGITAGLE